MKSNHNPPSCDHFSHHGDWNFGTGDYNETLVANMATTERANLDFCRDWKRFINFIVRGLPKKEVVVLFESIWTEENEEFLQETNPKKKKRKLVSVRLGIRQNSFHLTELLHVTISFVHQSTHDVNIFAYKGNAWIHDPFEKHNGKVELKYFTLWLRHVKKRFLCI